MAGVRRKQKTVKQKCNKKNPDVFHMLFLLVGYHDSFHLFFDNPKGSN